LCVCVYRSNTGIYTSWPPVTCRPVDKTMMDLSTLTPASCDNRLRPIVPLYLTATADQHSTSKAELQQEDDMPPVMARFKAYTNDWISYGRWFFVFSFL